MLPASQQQGHLLVAVLLGILNLPLAGRPDGFVLRREHPEHGKQWRASPLKEIEMALTEQTMNDKIEVVQLAAGYPVVQVRTATIIMRDGEEISRTFHRHALMPDADLSGEEAEVVAIASAVFSDEAKAAYAAQEVE